MTEQTEMAAESSRREIKQAFTGRHAARIVVTGPGSEKHTEHHAIALDGAGVTYRPGDALGVFPVNDAALVTRILERIGATGGEVVTGPRGETLTIADALARAYSLAAPSRKLLEILAARGAASVAPLLEPGNAAHLKDYLSGPDSRDVLDVLDEHRGIRVEPAELTASLRSLLPRLYSIASSQAAHPDEVHVLVVSVTFAIRDRPRTGVASTWLNDRWPLGATAPMYVQDQQKHFSMPDDPATPMIMVGPGTGVAPFRAFLEERRARGASGANWLFFGEQHEASDFFYAAELNAWQRDGFLRLDTAFSRDQPQKIYVQHRMREHERDLYDWLERGAELFVCGDKQRMAADVDRELHAIVERVGGKTPDQAREYVESLRRTKRYKRDVY